MLPVTEIGNSCARKFTGVRHVSITGNCMSNHGGSWVLVLAAGDGCRRHSMATNALEATIPKQYCARHDGTSFLYAALQRALTVTMSERVCVVVAEQHRHWWSRALKDFPVENVIVQPESRGTAIGILLPLLHILQRDPEARIVLLPSDHHVRDEDILARSLTQAVRHIDARDSDLLLLGVEPEEADTGLGYIMPGFSAGPCTFQLARFIEKPDAAVAQDLIENGALWNAFIVVAMGRALLQMFDRKYGDIVMEMRDAIRRCVSCSADLEVLGELYARLPQLDFSRDIVEGQEANLQVLAVPPCGWRDLGTPEHVEEGMRRTAYDGPDSSQVTTENAYLAFGYTARMAG